MANFNLYFPKLVDYEGSSFETVPGDNGGCTKYGIILDDLIEYYKNKSLTCEAVKDLSYTVASTIAKKMYWDYFKADDITNQSIAEFIVDGAYNQGRRLIAKYVQEIIHVTKDGVIGPLSLAGINKGGQELFDALKLRREQRYNAIVLNNPSQKKFIHGWMNRLNKLTYIK